MEKDSIYQHNSISQFRTIFKILVYEYTIYPSAEESMCYV